MSLLVVLKSPFVDVEDFDRVVSAGAGKLDPGALLLDFTLLISLSVRLVVLTTHSAAPGPPAEPLDRQSVALSVRERVNEGKQQDALADRTSIGQNPDKKLQFILLYQTSVTEEPEEQKPSDTKTQKRYPSSAHFLSSTDNDSHTHAGYNTHRNTHTSTCRYLPLLTAAQLKGRQPFKSFFLHNREPLSHQTEATPLLL